MISLDIGQGISGKSHQGSASLTEDCVSHQGSASLTEDCVFRVEQGIV